ncbi:hypothetical protein [Paracraurococcus ruber]|uniref:hypothetical protein n=1 Tax=Paracraurococcus ruber TaxID=77675 RepID=UPI0013050C07|nr:hypothetical protein [Paracraurococcus ruber]
MVDVHAAHVCDIASIGALDHILRKRRRRCVPMAVIGTDEASQTLVYEVSLHD